MHSVLRNLARILSYLALAFVVSGFAAMIFIGALDVCPRFDTGAVQCTTPFYEGIAQYAMMAVMLTVFTLIPGLLAIAGLVFLVIDLLRWRRRKAV